MEYNTTRNKLIIPEYGRNIQKMIEYAIKEEDKEKRNKLAEGIINIMSQIHPQLRDVGDYKHKLWDHLHIIANFKLDVDSPYPPPPQNTLTATPERISYSVKKIKFRHYGKNAEEIIKKASEYEEGPEKEALTKIIANHLKKLYLSWNRDSVDDELIEQQLTTLSDGKLKLSDDVKLEATSDILARNRRKKFSSKASHSQSNNGKSRKRK